ncbi:MAG: hypothetical protein J2P34_07970, partial [Actinobacteria bacterium]|nr:hypothetical protein [Actinomycetota bacterium]
MAIAISEDRGGAAAPGLPAPAAARRGRRVRLPRSPKVLIGLGGLVFFLLLAILGPMLAPQDPGASANATASLPQPPSAAHWLGTTQQQQDVFSQLLAGGR